MSLRGILYDSKELIETNIWNSRLEALLNEMDKHAVILADIQKSGDSLIERLTEYGLAAEECLLLAASDEVIGRIGNLPIAVLGCEKDGTEMLHQAEFVTKGFETVDFYFLEKIYQRKHNLPWIMIETKRCLLREITLADLDRLYEIYDESGITEYMEGLFEDRKEEEEFTKAYIENMYLFYGYGMWVVVEKETGILIGRAGLDHLDVEEESEAELGYVIAAEYQNQGFATEVCEAVLKFAKENLEFESVNCMIQKENKVSIRLAEKLGFQWLEEMVYVQKPMQRYRKVLMEN